MEGKIAWLIVLSFFMLAQSLFMALKIIRKRANKLSNRGSQNESAAHYIPGKSKICIDQGKEIAEMKVEIKNIKAIFKVADIKNREDHQMLSTKIDQIKNLGRYHD